MDSTFKYSLSSEEESEIIEFLESQNYYSVLQNPRWDKAVNRHKGRCFYISRAEGGIVAFSLITERIMVASLMFGPVGVDAVQIFESVIRIGDYYANKGFARLEVQLGIPVNQASESIEYSIFRKINFKQGINKHNWTSIEVCLNKQTDDLFRLFSNNHKRSITKSQKLGLKVEVLTQLTEIQKFSDLFDEMYKRRAVFSPFNDSFEVFKEIFVFFQNNSRGFFAGVYDAENNFCGGACFTITAKSLMYQYGCTSGKSKFPVLHIAFFEVMKMAKAMNLVSMDLCGVNLLVDEADQVYQINKFKTGFGGQVVYYPRKMTFMLNRWKSVCYDLIKFFYNIYRRL